MAATYEHEQLRFRPPKIRLHCRLGHSRRDRNFTFNQNYPARAVKPLIACTKEIGFYQKLLEKAYFIFKMASPAMASSDFWRVTQVKQTK